MVEHYGLLLLRATLETPIFIFLSVLYAGKLFSARKLLPVLIIAIISTFIIRSLPISFGIHTILMIFIFIMLLHSMLKVDLTQAVKGVILAFLTLLLVEWVSLALLTSFSMFEMESIMADPWQRFLAGIPSLVVLLLIALFIHKKVSRVSYRRREDG